MRKFNDPAHGLAKAKKSKYHECLSTRAVVVANGKYGFASIKFTEELVKFLGKLMPWGLSAIHPAYFRIVQIYDNEWRLFCCYLDSKRTRRQLATYAELPEWLIGVRWSENNGYDPTTDPNARPLWCKPRRK